MFGHNLPFFRAGPTTGGGGSVDLSTVVKTAEKATTEAQAAAAGGDSRVVTVALLNERIERGGALPVVTPGEVVTSGKDYLHNGNVYRATATFTPADTADADAATTDGRLEPPSGKSTSVNPRYLTEPTDSGQAATEGLTWHDPATGYPAADQGDTIRVFAPVTIGGTQYTESTLRAVRDTTGGVAADWAEWTPPVELEPKVQPDGSTLEYGRYNVLMTGATYGFPSPEQTDYPVDMLFPPGASVTLPAPLGVRTNDSTTEYRKLTAAHDGVQWAQTGGFTTAPPALKPRYVLAKTDPGDGRTWLNVATVSVPPTDDLPAAIANELIEAGADLDPGTEWGGLIWSPPIPEEQEPGSKYLAARDTAGQVLGDWRQLVNVPVNTYVNRIVATWSKSVSGQLALSATETTTVGPEDYYTVNMEHISSSNVPVSLTRDITQYSAGDVFQARFKIRVGSPGMTGAASESLKAFRAVSENFFVRGTDGAVFHKTIQYGAGPSTAEHAPWTVAVQRVDGWWLVNATVVLTADRRDVRFMPAVNTTVDFTNDANFQTGDALRNTPVEFGCLYLGPYDPTQSAEDPRPAMAEITATGDLTYDKSAPENIFIDPGGADRDLVLSDDVSVRVMIDPAAGNVITVPAAGNTVIYPGDPRTVARAGGTVRVF